MTFIWLNEQNPWRRLLLPAFSGLPLREAEALTHMRQAISEVVTGKTVNDKAARCWSYRERTISRRMPRTGTKNLTGTDFTAESGVQGFQIDAHVQVALEALSSEG
jgi:hypothetical protein